MRLLDTYGNPLLRRSRFRHELRALGRLGHGKRFFSAYSTVACRWGLASPETFAPYRPEGGSLASVEHLLVKIAEVYRRHPGIERFKVAMVASNFFTRAMVFQRALRPSASVIVFSDLQWPVLGLE